MKKLLILALSACVLFTACQATPKNPIVVNKDSDRVVELAQDESAGVKIEDMNIPDNYLFELETDTFKISADATVFVPDKIPTARVNASGFTQEMVTGFFNYLYPNEKPYISIPDDELTKQMIEEQIVQYKRMAAGETDVEVYEGMSWVKPEEAEEYIVYLQELYETAPDETERSPLEVSDGTYSTDIWELNGEEYDKLDVVGDNSHFYVSSAKEGGEIPSELFYDRTDKLKIDSEALNPDRLSIEDAKQICEDFLSAGGVEDVQYNYYIDSPYSDLASEPVYYIYYTRTVEGVPTASMPPFMGFQSADGFNVPWYYENIEFIVGNDGLYSVSWHDNTEVQEVIVQDTGILSFDEATAIFEDMAKVVFGIKNENDEIPPVYVSQEEVLDAEGVGGQVTLPATEISTFREITVDEVVLAPIRIYEKDATSKQGIYTPAWVFYGTGEEWDMEYNFENLYKTPVMVINAIDGSLIDIAKGY